MIVQFDEEGEEWRWPEAPARLTATDPELNKEVYILSKKDVGKKIDVDCGKVC